MSYLLIVLFVLGVIATVEVAIAVVIYIKHKKIIETLKHRDGRIEHLKNRIRELENDKVDL